MYCAESEQQIKQEQKRTLPSVSGGDSGSKFAALVGTL